MKEITFASTVIILVLILAVVGYCTDVQESTASQLEQDVKLVMEAVLVPHQVHPGRSLDIAKKYGGAAVPAVERYLSDNNTKVRVMAYRILHNIGSQSKDAALRRQIVNTLVLGLTTDIVVYPSHLLSFGSADFSDEAKEILRKRLTMVEQPRYLLLIIGLVNMRSEIPKLKSLLIDEQNYKGDGLWWSSTGWYARLALARMGSEEDIAKAIEAVEAESNEILRVSQLLRMLAYVRQPEVVCYIQKYLESDKCTPGFPEVDCDVMSVGYSQYALALLTQILEGIPIKYNGIAYSKEQIDLARKWMREQKEFSFKDGEIK